MNQFSKSEDLLRKLKQFDASGSFGIFTDITALKQVEEKLLVYRGRFRSLALELSLVEEKERRHVIMDLQDRLGQSLAYCGDKLIELKEFESMNDIKDSLNEIYV
jgi:phosphopantetheine adenylyltransferase